MIFFSIFVRGSASSIIEPIRIYNLQLQISIQLTVLQIILSLQTLISLQQILLHKMDSSSGQQPKQQRRKRKDPESRDFTCKCGKSYLSYAAAYTHVKNKHAGDNQFLSNISKPDREKLKRGRPKEKKVFSITSETEKLSIVEEAILQIYQLLERVKENNSKIILEGNQHVRPDELMIAYQELKKQIGDPGLTLFIDHDKFGATGKMLNQFIESLNKHFVPSIAVKIIWFIDYIFAGQIEPNDSNDLDINLEQAKAKINDEIISRVWDNTEQIPDFIFAALEKWVKTLQKVSENTANDQ